MYAVSLDVVSEGVEKATSELGSSGRLCHSAVSCANVRRFPEMPLCVATDGAVVPVATVAPLEAGGLTGLPLAVLSARAATGIAVAASRARRTASTPRPTCLKA